MFLPGMGEIMTLLDQLQNNKRFSPKSSDRYTILKCNYFLSLAEEIKFIKRIRNLRNKQDIHLLRQIHHFLLSDSGYSLCILHFQVKNRVWSSSKYKMFRLE